MDFEEVIWELFSWPWLLL